MKYLGSTVTSSQGLPSDQRYFLLGVDGHGLGTSILAKGNPDTAKNIATFVPGTGSNLAGISGGKVRSDRMFQAATRAGSGETSVITWQGYHAPQNIPQAASTSYADNGKAAFDNFQQGLRATHQGPPSHDVAIGHSYGTTLIGHAARDGNVASNDLVFVASPGVGVDSASQLHVAPDHVYATEATNDIIHATNPTIPGTRLPRPADIAMLGPDPTNPTFGGQTFDSAPGAPGPWYTGGLNAEVHSQYWDPKNPSLINMADIIAGKQPTAH